MTDRTKRRLEQRDKVLSAARRCFVRRGFHVTGMAEIAKACRMSVGNIYHYFPNKDAIVKAITEQTRSRIMPVLRQLESHADPVEGIIGMILFGVEECYRDSNARLWVEILAEAPRNRRIRKSSLAFDRDFQLVLKRLMERGIQSGRLPAETDIEAASIWLVALLDGAMSRISIQPDLDLTRTLKTLSRAIRGWLCPVAAA